MENKQTRGTFSGRLGFVLAAAGSAVGLGNIWRFPYLAAKDGGGLFLVIYLLLALTFGFTLLITEIAIGRKTGQSPLTAYRFIHPKMGWVGILACLIPALILPYYCSIGGWVLKYLSAFLTFQGQAAAAGAYFTGFITAQWEPIIWFLIYLLATSFVVYKGVNKGIEKFSTVLMPILVVLILGIAIFSLFLRHTDDSGITRTGLQGLKVYVVPNFEGMTVKQFFVVLTDAMGQLFYSISVAMGIMITYGSYVKKETNLTKSVNQIEIFDTAVAFLAGMMIIPAVYAFMGPEGLNNSGPGLMFKALPKVFDAMGGIGTVVGIAFFVMVFFAALTSSISIMEALVSSFMDKFHMNRKKATLTNALIALVVGIIVCMGYTAFYFEASFGTVVAGQILDVLDYISNSILMPVVAIATCILVGWVVKPKTIIDEVTRNGEAFGRKGLYVVMVKYITPVMLAVLLAKSLGIL